MRGAGRSIVLGVGFGLALDVLGVLLILSGSVAAGVAVLVISTIIVLGVVFSRRGGSGRGRRRSGRESAGFGGAYAGDAYGDNGGDGGGDGGGFDSGGGGFDGGGFDGGGGGGG